MLSPRAAEVVRATLPTVSDAIGDITRRFYAMLFRDNPELLDSLFNRSNQANGSQQSALAASIATFASALLEHPDTPPETMLARIAHRHASLGITPEQYDTVHKYLFAAIADVLGEAATPPVVEAWEEVYWLMAHALIALEGQLYHQAGLNEAGTTWRQFTVVDRKEETDQVATLMLRPQDHGELPPFKAGQYVSVRVDVADGTRQIRQYSLSGASRQNSRWWITVKRHRTARHPEAGTVSTFLHEHIHPGAELTLSAPFGEITLDDATTPLLLVSAGIGITPMIAKLEYLACTGSPRRVIAVHGDRSAAEHALRTDFSRLVKALPHASSHLWYEDCFDAEAAGATGEVDSAHSGWVDLGLLDLPSDLGAHLCGPVPFLKEVRAQLIARGIPPRRIHHEAFGPDAPLGQN